MLKKIIILLFVFCGSHPVFSQMTIPGKVSGADGKPLSFVSVIIEHNGKRLGFTATNESGRFSVSIPADTARHFTIHFSLVGYISLIKTYIYPDTVSLAGIVLTADKNSLANVTVTSSKPLVTQKPDRYIINVENSFLANGNSALDVLQRSPGLWVDYNGSIRIRGNQSVTVMINDVVQRMSGDELAEYLKTLRSEDISKIEVIPNPPAEYEAAGSGGIVHIILKKARKDGLNGSVFSQYRQQGKDPYYGGGASGDYKSGNLYLTGGFSLSKDINNSFGNNLNSFANGYVFSSKGTRHNENGQQQYRMSLAYDLSKTQSLVIQSVAGGIRLHHGFLNDVVQHFPAGNDVAGTNTTDWLRNMFQTSNNALYQLKTDTAGSVLKIKAEYTTGSRKEVNTFTGIYNDHSLDEILISNTPSETRIFSTQADHLQVMKKEWQFRTGIKYAGIKRNNIVGIYPFVYHEDLLMGYMALEKTHRKTSVKLGLRAEQTWSQGNSDIPGTRFSKSYIGLFPSVFVSRQLNEQKGSGLFFSYARRLQRPGFNELNPYRLQLSTVASIKGNPALLPQYTDNFELTWQAGKGISFTGYVSLTNNIISQLTTPAGNQVEHQFFNLDRNNSYGLNMEAPFRISKTWSVSNGFSVYHADYTTQSFHNSRNSFLIRHNQSILLPSLFDIDISASYRSAYANANSRVSDFCFTDIGFTRKLLKGRARVRFYVSDIFNVTREAEQTDYLGAHSEFYQKRQTRNFAVSLNYNFSAGKKFNAKKIEQSSSEEKARIGN